MVPGGKKKRKEKRQLRPNMCLSTESKANITHLLGMYCPKETQIMVYLTA